MCESVSVSSGPMWTNCDDVQHAVQPWHGTSASAIAPDRALHLGEPRREVTGSQVALVVHGGIVPHGQSVP